MDPRGVALARFQIDQSDPMNVLRVAGKSERKRLSRSHSEWFVSDGVLQLEHYIIIP